MKKIRGSIKLIKVAENSVHLIPIIAHFCCYWLLDKYEVNKKSPELIIVIGIHFIAI